jgi:hypothetical protein
MVYGKGHLAWECLYFIFKIKIIYFQGSTDWALRSPLYPLFYAIPFWLLKIFSFDSAFIIRWIPNIINAFLFAFADICYINWSRKVVGSSGFFNLKNRYIFLNLTWMYYMSFERARKLS